MTRGRRNVLIVVACAWVVVAVALAWPREPRYMGKTLSQWLDLYGQPPKQGSVVLPTHPANAVTHIGTSALPALVRWVSLAPPRPWQTNLQHAAGKLPQPLGRWASSMLESKHEIYLSRAKSGFQILADKTDPALPELFRLMEQKKAEPAAINILTIVPYLSTNAMRPLIEQLRSPGSPPNLRRGIVMSLVYHGDWLTQDSLMVKALCECLHDRDPWLVFDAAMLLLHTEPLLCQKAMAELLVYKDSQVVKSVVMFLPNLPEEEDARSGPIVPALVQCLRHADPQIVSQAALALGRYRAREDVVVPALTNYLANVSADSGVRVAAAKALGCYRERANPAVPALVAALKERNPSIRRSAREALERIPAYEVPVLIELLSDPEAVRRAMAANALGDFKASAEPSIPALSKALSDPDEAVRQQAAEALLKIPQNGTRKRE